ncbi:MAG: AAA family ATPase [Planctomycetota bacterium]
MKNAAQVTQLGEDDGPESLMGPEIRRLVQYAGQPSLHDRVASAFLGSTQWVQRERTLSNLRAGLVWEALPEFVASLGAEVAGVAGYDDGATLLSRPKYKAIDLGRGEVLEAPTNVTAYLERDGERTVVRFEKPEYYDDVINMRVMSLAPPEEFVEQWFDHVRDHNRLRGKALRPNGRLVQNEETRTWDDLYLAGDIKERIRFHIEYALEHGAALHEQLGIKRRRGMILHGPPGTGKTLLGRILADQLGKTFIWATPGDLCEMDSIQGLFELARMLAPVIVFLEDIDILAEDRSTSGHSALLGELMNQIDGCNGDHVIVTMATTNRLDVVEDAIRNRPGRFEQVIEIPAPDKASARAYLTDRLAAHDCDDVDLLWLAATAEGSTGAALEELANLVLTLAWKAADGEVNGGLQLTRTILEEAVGLWPGKCGPAGNLGFGLPAERAKHD